MGQPAVVVSGDYPSFKAQHTVAAANFDRLSPSGKILVPIWGAPAGPQSASVPPGREAGPSALGPR